MTIRLPSIQTLSRVFEDPKQARRILEMSRAELLELEACIQRERECLNPPTTRDLRLTALNALDSSLHGVEAQTSTNDQIVEYLNTGDTYADTLLVWCGQYRVQSLGDFIETQQRRGVHFA